jgi:hypothetical protein
MFYSIDMKTYSTETIIVHFNQAEQGEIELLVNTLQEKFDDLLTFFRFEKLMKPVNIIIYADKNEYVKHMLKYTDIYQDWMIGDTNDGNINMLSLENCRMTQSHKGMTLSEYIKVVIAELDCTNS